MQSWPSYGLREKASLMDAMLAEDEDERTLGGH